MQQHENVKHGCLAEAPRLVVASFVHSVEIVGGHSVYKGDGDGHRDMERVIVHLGADIEGPCKGGIGDRRWKCLGF